jgi:hypothetical protein
LDTGACEAGAGQHSDQTCRLGEITSLHFLMSPDVRNEPMSHVIDQQTDEFHEANARVALALT